jgi:RNA polymerase sigma-70 factor (ECF subfamily)
VHRKASSINIGDDVLVEQYKRGDAAAMERLVLKYQNRLYNVILRICTNPDDAAELTQETFVKVIENIARFQGKSSFYTWAFRIAVNLTLNLCRRRARLGFRSLDAGECGVGDRTALLLKEFLGNDKSPDPANVAQNRELAEIVKQCLMKLDDSHRTVVILRDIEGMSYAQMAQVLDVELGTVRSRLSRARHKLKEILEAVL